MGDKVKAVMLYSEYLTHFEMLTREERGDLIMLILKYINSEACDLSEYSGAVKMAFSFIKLDIDRDMAKYAEKCEKSSQSIQKRWQKEKEKENGSYNEDTNVYERINDNTNVYERINDNTNVYERINQDTNVYESIPKKEKENKKENENKIEKEKENNTLSLTRESRNGADAPAPQKREPFKKPTLDEINAYIWEKGYTFSGEQFIAYYESNGWKVGKNPMKSWKSACATWQARQSEYKYGKSESKPESKPSYDADEVERHWAAKYL